MEIERVYPRGNFHSGFDASHLLQLSRDFDNEGKVSGQKSWETVGA